MSRLAPPTEADEKGEQKRIQVEPKRKSDRCDRKTPRMRRRWRWRRERRCSRWEGSRRRPRPHPPSLVGQGSTASLTRTATCRSGETLNFSDCINGLLLLRLEVLNESSLKEIHVTFSELSIGGTRRRKKEKRKKAVSKSSSPPMAKKSTKGLRCQQITLLLCSDWSTWICVLAACS